MKLQKLYLEINKHLLNDLEPSIYLNEIYDKPAFKKFPFDMLYKLKETEQSKIHHPEGNVWNHVMLVVDEAAKLKVKSKNSQDFMWAALLHDIGKPSTTKNRKGKITSYDHDKVGEELSEQFLNVFTDDRDFVYRVSKLVKYHMQILFVANNLPFADIESMKLETDYKEIALLGFCDRMGRTNSSKKVEEENIKRFLKVCKNFKLNRV